MEWLLAVYDKPVPLGEAALDVAVGFVLVLVMLILLIAIFWIFGKVMEQMNRRNAQPKPVKETPAPRAAAPSVPVAEEGISDEVVAVIAAAIAAMAPEGTTYAVRRVSRQRGERSVWAAAGVAENTRPF